MDENIFLEKLKKLNLRFQIAEISKKTGYSESVVSRYLNGSISVRIADAPGGTLINVNINNLGSDLTSVLASTGVF